MEEPMSLYQLHRCAYDFVRASGVSSGTASEFDSSRYDLTDEERTAFETRAVPVLYRMGLHPVLLNAFCRAVGFTRDDYRKQLEPFAEPETRRGRWSSANAGTSVT
jgi:hypothetical protein